MNNHLPGIYVEHHSAQKKKREDKHSFIGYKY